jgi:hypothetical protein
MREPAVGPASPERDAGYDLNTGFLPNLRVYVEDLNGIGE